MKQSTLDKILLEESQAVHQASDEQHFNCELLKQISPFSSAQSL